MTDGIRAGGGRIHGHEYTIRTQHPCLLTYHEVVTKEHLYRAWNDFVHGKRMRGDVNDFAISLADNIHDLYETLVGGTYVHGPYQEYTITDPKKRVIHKASVRDRVVHRLLYNALYPYFDKRFIHDS